MHSFRTRLMAAAVAACSVYATASQAQVYISEIHYDNAGTDTGEAIEITGPAGTDLSGYSIVLYNGSNGLMYGSASALTSILADQDGGLGTEVFNFPTNGLQNGSPDGIALLDGSDTVVEFLSYEGELTANDGFATGHTSTDIGVSQGGTTPTGASLQRCADSASWVALDSNSFGAVNNGTDCAIEPPPTGNSGVRINEFHYDNAGSDTGEFIEIAGPAGADLNGWSVVLYNGSNGTDYNTLPLAGSLPDCSEQGQGVTVLELPSNGLQNGSPDGIALIDNNGSVKQFISYEGQLSATSGPAAGQDSVALPVSESSSTPAGFSLQLSVDGATWQAPAAETRGALNNGLSCPAAEPPPALSCDDPATALHQIQGAGAASPLAGAIETVDAVVVAVFDNGNDSLGGYFLQEEDADTDADPATSEGLFVFDPGADVNVGERVRVRGEVKEQFGLTEITNVSEYLVCDTDVALPTPASVSFPLSATADLESFEGMSIHLPQELVIAEYFNYDRFGEMVLALPLPGDNRPLQPTSVADPGAAANDRQVQNNLRRITLDDGLTSQNPALLRHPNGQPFSLDNRFRGGDSVTDVVGVLSYSFGQYRVQPTVGATHISMNTRPTAPDAIGGNLRVASFNVLNFFTTLDENGATCGPAALGCRGADNAGEFDRQRSKIIAAMARMEADVIGLVELENNASDAIASLVQGLVDATGQPYAYVDTGTIGTDAIKVGLIYRTDRVEPRGLHAILDGEVDSRFIDNKNRPVLAQSFTDLSSAGIFTVAVNHLKSKGSACTDIVLDGGIADSDAGDGQGNCNGTRTQAAAAQVDWLATDPTGSGDSDVIILGDLNAYAQEDPIRTLENGVDGTAGSADDYINLIAQYQGPAAYSYVFSGQFGYLDHALASTSMAEQVSGVTEWHINADEPDVLDYDTSFKPDEQDALFEANAFRSSDHDPVIIGLAPQGSLTDIMDYFDRAVSVELPGPGADGQWSRDEMVLWWRTWQLRAFRYSLAFAVKSEQYERHNRTCRQVARLKRHRYLDRSTPEALSQDMAARLTTMLGNYQNSNCR